MPFKFVNWFLEQKKNDSKIGKLAQRCLDDENFPFEAKLFEEITDYFEENKFKKSDMNTLLKAWDEFRSLDRVEVLSMTQIKSKYFDSYL